MPTDDESEDSMYPAWSNAAVADHPMTVAELARTTDRLTAPCGKRHEELLTRISEQARDLSVPVTRSAG